MGLDILQEKRISLRKVVSGTSLIAGTTIGAGMLGIPLVTSEAGFFPAACATFGVWIFMVLTGLLYVEVALSLPLNKIYVKLCKQPHTDTSDKQRI